MKEQLLPCQCGQQFPADRDACPYCGEEVKATWVFQEGRLSRLVEMADSTGKTQFLTDGQLLSRADAIRSGQMPPRRTSEYFSIWRICARAVIRFFCKPRSGRRKTEMLTPELADLWISKVKEETSRA